MTRERLMAWVAAYERAWRTPGTAAVATLFAPEATYSPAPYAEPHRGLAALERFWEAEREGAEEVFTMSAAPVAVEGDTGVVRLLVRYGEPVRQEYRDLWVVILDAQGRCTAFEEWPFWPPGTPGSAAPGAG